MTAPSIDPKRGEAAEWYLSLMAAAAVLFVYATITDRVHEHARTLIRVLLLLAVVVLPGWRRSWTLWGALAAALGLQAAMTPLDLPNHHYALTYTALALALALSSAEDKREAHLRNAARWLLVGIMGFATLQKLASPAFMDGSYLGEMLATGRFARPLGFLCDACRRTAEANLAAVEQFRQTVPAAGQGLTLSALPHLPGLAGAALSFGLAIVAVELWLALAFAARPERRLTHWSLLLFAAGLVLLRQEFLFISTVSLLGLLSCPPSLVWERRAYGIAVVVFASAAAGAGA